MLALLEYEAFQYRKIVDWSRSMFVGDRDEDEACAKNAGVYFMHIDDFLKNPHQFEVDKKGVYNVVLALADQVSSSVEAAKEYLESEGFNPDEIEKEGGRRIKEILNKGNSK